MSRNEITHFLDIFSHQHALNNILNEAIYLKKHCQNFEFSPLQNKTITMIFDKPSTRTRLSFEIGMHQLGGTSYYVKGEEVGLSHRESIQDVARVMSRYTDFVLIRTFEHEDINTFSEYSSVPVINGLFNIAHPCQTIADLLTILEHKQSLADLKIVYLGDLNNVSLSLKQAAEPLGFQFVLSGPKHDKFQSDASSLIFEEDPMEAVKDADIIYTDVWVSMGQESNFDAVKKTFQPYQVTMDLIRQAKKDVRFMHCLPAQRDNEVTNEVMESSYSIIFDQAENRLHAQKAILTYLGGVMHG